MDWSTRRDEDWWRELSSCSGSSSCSDSEYDEWPVRLCDTDRELFYIECNNNEQATKQGSALARSEDRNKVTFHDSRPGEIRQVGVVVRKHNLGRRASLCETLLGLVPGRFSSPPGNHRIMIAGFIPDVEPSTLKKIKIGDCLLSVGGVEVSHENIDQVLATLSSSNVVNLKLQRITVCDITSKGVEVDQFLQAVCGGAAASCGGSLLVVSREEDAIVYCYPEGLAASRGVFLTLLRLVPGVCGAVPQVSSVVMSGELTHCVYFQDQDNLVVMAFRDIGVSLAGIKELADCFFRAIKFSFQTLTRAALSDKPRLDLLIDCFYKHYCTTDYCKLLPAAKLFPLPTETRSGLDNALSCLEAAHFKGKRLLSVLGSCVFYKSVALCSHLPVGLLGRVDSFCWSHGLHTEAVGRLLAWKRVFWDDTSAYLLLLAQNQYKLAVLLEGSTRSGEEYSGGANVVYVELAQTALDTVTNLGVADLVENWVGRQGRQQQNKACSRGGDQLMRSLRLNSHPSGTNEGSLSLSSLSTQKRGVPKHSSEDSASVPSSEDTWSQESVESTTPAQSLLLPTRLMEGLPNCFLHYFHLESESGIVLSSSDLAATSPVLDSFHKSCVTARAMLTQKCDVSQVGLMFQTQDSVVYWVVGKRASESRQVFVCYEDSMSLSLVELAFRMALTM